MLGRLGRSRPFVGVPSFLRTTPDPRALTSAGHWDDYWTAAPPLPVIVECGGSPAATAILEVVDRFLASNRPLSVLEIGGAPGGYAAHLHRQLGHDVCVLDNAPVGIEMTRRNFELLGIPGRVLERDLFETATAPPRFDAVYSLGLIEHFANTEAVVAAHLAYLRPGGRLIVGCPNLRGLNHMLLQRLSPSALEWHHLDMMNLREWPRFEGALGLRPRFRAYVAGFQPGMFWRREREGLVERALVRGLRGAERWLRGELGRRMAHVNSRHWSYYMLGVYDAPAGE